MKNPFKSFLLFSILILGVTTSPTVKAAVNELITTTTLSADPMPGGVPVLSVLPSTTYTHTISITNNLASKAPIVKIVLRLPDPFVMVDPVVCPLNWTEVSTQNNGRGVGMINCVENGLDTSIPNPISNPQYDLAYGQTTSVSFSFTTPSVNGTTDLALQVFYINSSGLMQGTWFSGSYAPAQIVVESPVAVVPSICTAWTYSDWSSCSASGNQTRSVISSSPNSCAGGSPVLSQSCTYVEPSTPVIPVASVDPVEEHQDLVRTIEDLENQAVPLEERPVTLPVIKAPKANDMNIVVASLQNDGASLERDIAKLNAQIKKVSEVKNVQTEIKEEVPSTKKNKLEDLAQSDNKVAISTEEVRSKSLWERIMGWFGFN